MIDVERTVMKRFTIKIASQRIEAIPGKKLSINERGHSTSANENCHFQKIKSENLKQKSAAAGANKRGPPVTIDCLPQKRQKMDRSVTQQCSALLKSLMAHPAGWVFNNPVDPVALNIPDYFSIISNPMDLVTIKSKLGKNLYAGIDEFASDIRLTFSNAKLYNPPTNNVHKMAEELNEIFEERWKVLEEKWGHERPKIGVGKISSGRSSQIVDVKQSHPRTPPLHSTQPKRSKPSEENVMRSSVNARVTAEVKISKPAENSVRKPVVPNSFKGTDGGSKLACSSMNAKPLLGLVAANCGKCGRNACQCSLHSEPTHTASDLSSEKSSGQDNRACSTDTSKLDFQEKSTSVSQISKSDPESDGAVSAVDDENICPSSHLTTPATDAASGEEWNSLFDVSLSPSKALRYATIKRRFADTILKAQNKTILDNGDKSDPMKLRLEKERLERRQHEEKAKIEAQIKAAEAASRRRGELELQRQREKERQAARIAVQKMEKTVVFEHNLEILKELEMLSGCSLSFNFQFGSPKVELKGEIGAHIGSPLERLGLTMKDDDFEDEDEFFSGDGGEEGEIIC